MVGMNTAEAIAVLVVGGTGESDVSDRRTQVSGMLANVTEHLDDRFSSTWVGYPASYGPATGRTGICYEDSVELGCARLARAFDAADSDPVMMLGYSQGAVVVRRFVTRLARLDPAALRRIVGLGLVADPHQPTGAVNGCTGSGVAGADDESVACVDAVPTYWVGTADDMICNASADSFIRDIADLTGALRLGSTREMRAWASAMWDILRSNRFQNARHTVIAPAQWRRDVHRLLVAGREVAGYLPTSMSVAGVTWRNDRGGRHTSYCVEPYRLHSLTDQEATGCEILARWMQVQATFTEPTRLAHAA